MTTFQDLVKSLPSDPNQKGLEFEKICKSYLLNSPFYKKQIKNVWLWSEWKDRWSNQDRGIDLIAETKSGEIWTDRQRAYYGNKRAALTKERIKKLESLKYWSWSKKNTSK